ncbi:CHAP domain-containing protein [Streptomyces sp. NPDC048211]|uniref:CHAP domain-containing protein n=1 Tax=Streptomyces sp. NPDC048211 TaxID=3365516 RepID=UPI0037204BB1
MVSCLGAGETNGNNTNYITRWYGLNDAWCDMTITYAAYHSGNESAVCFGGKYAYTVAHAQAFKDRGAWHTDTAGIRRGDIVFFDWNGSNSISAIDHVGIVESVNGSAVHTIEGNIGNVCARKVRYADTIAGYGRPKYVNPTPTTPQPPTTPPPASNLPTVRLSVVQRAANSPTGKYGVDGTAGSSVKDTTLVQNALIKLGLCVFPGRGEFGPLTVQGYAKWQRSLGYTGSDADGHPGLTSLTKLGAKSGLFKAGN